MLPEDAQPGSLIPILGSPFLFFSTPHFVSWSETRRLSAHSLGENARNLRPTQIAGPIDLVTVDVSFISVAKVLPAVVAAAGPGTEYLVLVKPQFELDRGDVGGCTVGAVIGAKDRVESVGAVEAIAQFLGRGAPSLRGLVETAGREMSTAL